MQGFSLKNVMLTLCDREPDRETDAIRILKDHMVQFNKLYRRQAG